MSDTKHIYLVRHGESRANQTGVREGSATPLTQRGRQQAIAVAERFKKLPIDIVLSSPYLRAYETADAIARSVGVPLEVVNQAHERKKPLAVCGKHRDDPDVQKILEAFEQQWVHDTKVDEGEHFTDVLERARELSHLLEMRPERHIVVTTHNFFLKLFTMHHLLGEFLTAEVLVKQVAYRMSGKNVGITHFAVHDGMWKLTACNDHAHLGALCGE